jgi:hypothetical protein
MKMPTRNDKMTTSNNKVLKKHNGNIMCIRLDMKYFLFNNKRHQDVEGLSLKELDMMLKDTKDKSA